MASRVKTRSDDIFSELRFHFNAVNCRSYDEFSLRSLWRSVIEQAFFDIRGDYLEKHALEHNRTRALLWFKSNNCRLVCDMAGVGYEVIERLARKYMTQVMYGHVKRNPWARNMRKQQQRKLANAN